MIEETRNLCGGLFYNNIKNTSPIHEVSKNIKNTSPIDEVSILLT